MTIEMIFVILILVSMFVALILEIARPAFIMFIALMLLVLSDIITTGDALLGFSNEGMLTIALLFIVTGAISNNPLLYKFIFKMMGNSSSYRLTLLKLLLPISMLSAFCNNTPVFVTMIPVIRKWCRKHNVSPSRFLLPMSYASIFGGMITLIGTATNLVIHGLMLDKGMPGFTMFQLALVSIPGAMLGILYLYFIGHKMLPRKQKTLEESFVEESKDYLTEAIVKSTCSFVGKSVKTANLKGLFLVEIIRGKERITPVLPDEVIQTDDHLLFSGTISTIIELQRIKGIEIVSGTVQSFNHLKQKNLILVEAVISSRSSLLHKTIKESDLRNKLNATVVAIRQYQQKEGVKLGDLKLQAGDTLLLLVKEDFVEKWQRHFNNDFFIVSEVDGSLNHNKLHLWFPLCILILMILLASFNILTMFKAALIATFIFIITHYINANKMMESIDFQVLLLIACSFGIGRAIESTGLASLIATLLVNVTSYLGVFAILIALYFVTNILTEVVTNSGAAVIMFPVALAISDKLMVDPMGLIVTITIAASASFITPIGYQTNLIAYSQGGYKFSDYIKVGLPLSIIYMMITVTIVSLFL